ncbi:MAG: glycosyl hydrolase [Candidatus Micrarchaeales archaeon]|nr:glycosyl hydrolase [Candidatus Micrarchaeales archaeon]
MRNGTVILAVLALAAVIVAVSAFLGLSPQHVTTTAASTTLRAATTVPVQSSGNVIFGVAASTNISAVRMAISNGIGYFRTDIANNRNQEKFISNVTAAGGHYIGILDYETVGAGTSPYGCISGCNWTLSDWNASVENAVLLYPEVHVWEIWNEPQFNEWQSGFLNGSVHNYFLMLKSAYSIIKAHNATDTVLCLGGDNIYTGGRGPSYADYLWAQQLWSYGASDYCDAISLHAYTSFTFLMTSSPDGANQTMGSMYNETIGAYENLTGKPIWITEVGIPSNNGTGTPASLNDSIAKQSEFLNQTYSLLLAKPYIKGIFWFNLIGYEHPPYEIDYGLLNATTLRPKPSFYDLIRFMKQYS